ncbi:hypothetical protein BH10CYA1_BH10CYA1_36050 [soil metagenome]
MSNQDEESKDSNLSGYQFFSADLNYNYFAEQTTNGDAPPAVTPFVLPTSTSSAATSSTVPSSVPVKSSKPFSVPSQPEVKPYVPEVKPYVSEVKPYTYVPITPAAAPVLEARPERVAYSLNDNEPEVTFEERVAAMERELAAANAASTAAQAAADAVAQAAAVRAAAEAAAAQPISPIPTFSRFSDAEPIPAEYLQVPAPVETGTQSGVKWNAYVQPNCAPDVFGPDFNFNRSLLKIFWRIDVDHNNRVSKNELALALQENWFGGDEKLLAKLLFEMYEEISPEAIFCDAGLSVNNILNYGPFSDMAREELEAQIPEPQPVRNSAPKTKNTKSSQSLRSLFKR